MKTVIGLVALNLMFCGSASAIDRSLDAKWQSWVDNAVSRKWEFSKTCYPNDNQGNPPYCTLALTSPIENNKQWALHEYYGVDSDNVPIGREVCEFSSVLIVRTCTNFDTQVSRREMYDTGKGTWHKVPMTGQQSVPQQRQPTVRYQ